MARKASVARDKKRDRLIEKYSDQWEANRSIALDSSLSWDERQQARLNMAKLPKNSHSTRQKNRCFVTGRSRGYIRHFGLSRITFRELALRGELPGIRKASW